MITLGVLIKMNNDDNNKKKRKWYQENNEFYQKGKKMILIQFKYFLLLHPHRTSCEIKFCAEMER